MEEFIPPLIVRHTFDTASLVAGHPPRWHHPNKVFLHRLSCPPGCTHSGQLIFARWQAPALPETIRLDTPTVLEPREDVFAYEASAAGCVEWHLNFAHWDLFCSYGGGLFAQDEMQVAEHPALGSLREALMVSDIKPFTVDINEPTPILIRGAQRRVAIATDRNAAEGRPNGLYGNFFMKASTEAIARATRIIDPPTLTNLLAMEAPCGSGVYSEADITFILRTALTGFAAVRDESRQAKSNPSPSSSPERRGVPEGSNPSKRDAGQISLSPPLLSGEGAGERGSFDTAENPSVVIHTGFWGCGAYGGNRRLMALLQIVAARAAGIDRLVFHTFDHAGSEALAEAQGIFEREVLPLGNVAQSRQVVTTIQGLRFEWGVSDGN